MKGRLQFLSIFTAMMFAPLISVAQSTLTISTGQINHCQLPSAPTRSIEYVDDGIIVTYNFANILTTHSEKVNGINFDIPGFFNSETEYYPSLPSKNDVFSDSYGDNFDTEILDTEFVDYEVSPAFHISNNANQQEFSLDMMADFDGFYPLQVISDLNSEIYRGRRILKVEVNPVQYNKDENITRIYTKIAYKLKRTDYGLMSFSESNIEDLPPLPNNSFYNSIIPTTPLKKASKSMGILPQTDMGEGLLILTSDELIPAAERLAYWKYCLGYRAYIDLVSDSLSIDKIKSMINWYYTNNDIQYVLFLGDENHIPATIHEFYSTEQDTVYNYRTDLPYLCMDGDDDYMPDIRHGRMPVSNCEEALRLVNKIINYELNPPTDHNFYGSGLHLAQYQPSGRDKSMEDQRFIFTSENIANYLADLYGHEVKRIYALTNPDDTPSRYNPKYTYQWSIPVVGGSSYLSTSIYTNEELDKLLTMPEEMQSPDFWYSSLEGCRAAMSYLSTNTPSYVFYSGHGNYHTWSKPGLYTNLLRGTGTLQKMKYPVLLFSITCLTGGYDYDECLTKYWLTTEGGALGAFACTGPTYLRCQGIQDEIMMNRIWPKSNIAPFFGFRQPDIWCKDIEDLIVESNFAEKYPIGMTMGQVLEESTLFTFWPSKSDDNYTKHHREITHYFGDPTMKWNTSSPDIGATPIIINRGGSSYIFFTKPADYVTIFNVDTRDVENYYYNVSEIPIKTEDIPNLVITSHGYGHIPSIIKGSNVEYDFLNQ